MISRRWRVIPGVLLGAALVTAVLADVLGRALGWGALGRGPGHVPQVAVTFDDGPSPRTPELLGILQEFNVKATFFVTFPACQAHPAALRQILSAGHQVEAHGRWHTHALLLTPWREWAQVRWHPRPPSEAPHHYRPPYGGHSPLTRLIARLNHRQIALWDVEGRDWLDQPAQELAAQTLAQVQSGSVILLHDGPSVTPELLRLLLMGLQDRNLQAVTLNALDPQRITWRAGLQRLTRSYGA